MFSFTSIRLKSNIHTNESVLASVNLMLFKGLVTFWPSFCVAKSLKCTFFVSESSINLFEDLFLNLLDLVADRRVNVAFLLPVLLILQFQISVLSLIFSAVCWLCPFPGRKHEAVTAAVLESLPVSVRSNIKLDDLNAFYLQLQQHLGNSTRSEKLTANPGAKCSSDQSKHIHSLADRCL